VTDLSRFASFWYSIVWAIRRGRYPRKTALAALLRNETIPADCQDTVQTFLAGLIDGTVKLPRGKRSTPMRRRLELAYRKALADRVFRLKQFYQYRGGWVAKDAYQAALEMVAKKYNITPSALDNYCYPRKPR
jgi:hypothetical protein